MDVRVVGVPVIDCDPIELGAEIAFDFSISSRVKVLRFVHSGASSGEMMNRK